ncbi:transposable element Tcb1 transposase [Trichonephila clavipes]|nr:transposable element Tcb1 transposase [Trichonephila clavipes]
MSRLSLLRAHVTLDSARFISGVLRPVALPFIRGLWNPTFQQDNERPHVAGIKQTEHIVGPVSSALFSYLYDSFKADRKHSLGHIGLYTRRPVKCVPLTTTHCRLRLTWSRKHALDTPQQWTCVMFSEESRLNLQSDSFWALIWRASGTVYHQENITERHRYGVAGRIVWGGMILGSGTDLHVQSVTMTGHIYRNVILE